MKYINTQNVKLLAKKYGKQVHDKELQVSSDFIAQVHELVEAVVKCNVVKQDSLAGTLRSTEWGNKCIADADSKMEEVDDEG